VRRSKSSSRCDVSPMAIPAVSSDAAQMATSVDDYGGRDTHRAGDPMLTLEQAAAVGRAEQGLAVVATLRADGTIQASLVNAGVLAHPASGEPVLAFVTYGRVKLNNLRDRPVVTTTFRSGWRWSTIEGRAELAGPDDPHSWLTPEQLRLLLREVFTAAGGSHDDWDEYDRVMARERRTAVLITPGRVYGSPVA
jgi:PPOX class probable F420-dependent enzyme